MVRADVHVHQVCLYADLSNDRSATVSAQQAHNSPDAAHILYSFVDDLCYHSKSLYNPIGKSWSNVDGAGHSYLHHPLILCVAGVYMWVALAWPAGPHVTLCPVSGRQKPVPIIIVSCPLFSEMTLT